MALSKFLDPKLDLTFKKIFGTEKNKNILIHFLNDILGFTEINTIQEVEFLSTIMDPEIASDKQSIVDVLCRDSSGARYVIEMQLTRDKGFEKRAQLYAAKAYSRQADKSGKYIDLKKVFFKEEQLESIVDRWLFFFSATWKVMVLWWLNSIFPDIRDNVYLTFQRVATSGMQA